MVSSNLTQSRFSVVQIAGGLILSTGMTLTTASPAFAQQLTPSVVEQQSTPTQTATPMLRSSGPEITATPDFYTLGAGDRINIDIFNVPEYTGERQVMVDGSLNLPLVGNLPVKGLTLRQAAEAITLAYRRYLRNPIVTVNLLTARPLRVSVAGQVRRPGSYDVVLTREAGTPGVEPQWPTVSRAIQLAGGIVQSADVGAIQVRRPQRSGEDQVITLNFWKLIGEGDLTQDITLRDGDSIFVPVDADVTPAEVTQLATASIAPTSMRVNVVGEVVTPGAVEVPPNTPLNQAILAAGGFNQRRARTGSVQLVRLNPDGTVSQRRIEVNLASAVNEQTNPPLRENDVILVGRSGITSFGDVVDSVFGTLGRIFPIFRLFD